MIGIKNSDEANMPRANEMNCNIKFKGGAK
jgi:hypothetical protein